MRARRPTRRRASASSSRVAARARASSSTTTPCSTRRRCASTWRGRSWRREGIEVDGEVGDPDPVHGDDGRRRRRRARRDHHLDAARRRARAGCERDLIERIRDATGLPVDARRRPTSPTRACASRSRSSSRTARRAATSCSSASGRRTRRPQGNDVFIVVVPLDNDERNAAAAARARLGNLLDRMRSEGLLAAGMIGDPDPYVATMNALQFYTVNAVVISTLPEERSGWMRQDLIARVRKASNIDDRARRRRARRRRDGRLIADQMEAAALPHSHVDDHDARPPRSAAGEPQLPRGPPVPRDAAVHHLRDHGLRGLLHRLLLHPGGERGPRGSRSTASSCRSRSRASTRRSCCSSSLTMHWAQTSIKNGNRFGLKAGIAADRSCSA